MNSVTIVRKLRRNRSPTENQPQNRPKRSLISRAWPTPGDRPEPDDHLLVDDQHRDQQQQHPQQAGAVVLARLRVGRDPAGVVVADHHDQPRADDRQQRQRPRAQAAVRLLVLTDRAERALDVADVGGVEHGALARRSGAGRVPPARSRCGCPPSARPPFWPASAPRRAGRSSQLPELRSGREATPHGAEPRAATSR